MLLLVIDVGIISRSSRSSSSSKLVVIVLLGVELHIDLGKIRKTIDDEKKEKKKVVVKTEWKAVAK